VQAYKIGSYALFLEPKRCKGCLLCVYSCPKQILFLNGSGKIAVREIEPCIFCRICEMRCPDFAIWVEKDPHSAFSHPLPDRERGWG
jgi:2-oxoglutarate ferredoxin oxidoreductase subunit delta